jgi:sulfite oxidase
MRVNSIRHAFSATVRTSTRRLESAGKSTRISLPVNTRPITTTRYKTSNSRSGSASRTIAIAAAAGLAGCLTLTLLGRNTLAEAPPKDDNDEPEYRLFRLDEINKHNRETKGYWVYRGDRVYDITDWVPNHPGGDVILRAVGGSVEPYWVSSRAYTPLIYRTLANTKQNIFTIHRNKDVYEILEQYFIGKIDPQDLIDGHAPQDKIDDPFKSDPTRDPALIVHTPKPCNAETPDSDLGPYVTPTEKFYVRNHLWVPNVSDPDSYRLTIELPDGEEASYSLSDLRTKFTQHTISATLQCSGNRRKHMTEGSRSTNGLQWGVGAISNAEWTGVKLRDVLAASGFNPSDIPDDIKHAQFVGMEAYGASIPIDKACDKNGDVLLAHSMNGAPIPRDHGYPLRVLVPGTVAARSVKWINKIVLSDEESTSQWQRRDYKCFGPNEGDKPNWDAAPAIQETPVQSAITSVRWLTADRLRNSSLARAYGLEEESIVLQGYAFSGGGRGIIRVDVSTDDGRTWTQAQLKAHESKGSKAWSWQQWELAIPARKARGYFCVKAVDEAYNSQPEGFEAYYNFRGNLANGWHRVPVHRSDQ